MEIKPLLTEEQQEILELISSMTYDEVNEWAKQFPICEGKSIDDYTQYIDDMTPEEFIKTYALIDITDRIMNCGNIANDDDIII